MATLNEEIVDEVKKGMAVVEIPGIRTVVISLGYTFVELDNEIMGGCFTPRSKSGSCAHYQKAGGLARRGLLELTELMLSGNPLEKSVGIAAVNAASRLIMDQNPERYEFAEKDFLDPIPFDGTTPKVGMVGNIGPFIPFLMKNASSLVVVDDNPAFMPGLMQNGYAMSGNISDLSDCEVVLITGSAAAAGVSRGSAPRISSGTEKNTRLSIRRRHAAEIILSATSSPRKQVYEKAEQNIFVPDCVVRSPLVVLGVRFRLWNRDRSVPWKFAVVADPRAIGISRPIAGFSVEPPPRRPWTGRPLSRRFPGPSRSRPARRSSRRASPKA